MSIGQFFQRNPDAAIRLTSGIARQRTHAQFTWAMSGPGGAEVLVGADHVIVAADGRLERITGFFGPLPALADLPPVHQAFLDAWNEDDADTRKSLLEASCVEDIALSNASVDASSRDGLSSLIGSFRAMQPSAQIVVVSGVHRYDAQSRLAWEIRADGEVLNSGANYAVHDAVGRYAQVVIFEGSLPTLPLDR
jgi:hypothetical protein